MKLLLFTYVVLSSLVLLTSGQSPTMQYFATTVQGVTISATGVLSASNDAKSISANASGTADVGVPNFGNIHVIGAASASASNTDGNISATGSLNGTVDANGNQVSANAGGSVHDNNSKISGSGTAGGSINGDSYSMTSSGTKSVVAVLSACITFCSVYSIMIC